MTRKIAVSLPDKTLERAKTAVARGKAPTVSNYIAQLIDQETANESFEEMIADFLEKSGATENEIRAAERQVLADFQRAGLTGGKGGRQRDQAPRKAG